MKKEVITKEKPIIDPINVDEHPIEQWKEKHTKAKLITVRAGNGDRHQFIIVRPTLSVMDMIQKYINDQKPHKYREAMINNCIKVGNTKLVETDDDLRNAVFERIIDLFEKLEVEEKEL